MKLFSVCSLEPCARTSYATRDCEYVNSETTKKEHTQKSKEYNTEKANNTKPKKQTRNNTTKKALLYTLGNLATSLGDVKDMFCFGFLSTCTLKHEPFVSGAYRHARRAPCRMPAGMHKVSNRQGQCSPPEPALLFVPDPFAPAVGIHPAAKLAFTIEAVERYAEKPISDGIGTDDAGRLSLEYLSLRCELCR